MTQLNRLPPEAGSNRPAPSQAEPDEQVGQDPAVAKAIEPVLELPELPVAEHPGRFILVHDALLAALNEEPLTAPGPAPGGSPRPGGH